MASGVDFGWGHVSAATLTGHGYTLVCRYLSHDGSKNLRAAEVSDFLGHGVDIVVVWESGSGRAKAGFDAGLQDGHDAVTQAQALGLPAGSAIYFAVDYDPAGNFAPVVAYFHGAGQPVTAAGYTVGVYACADALDAVMGAGKADFGWQTLAWSHGRLSPRASLYQAGQTVTLDGVVCDVDQILAPYGGWARHTSSEVDLTPDEHNTLTKAGADAANAATIASEIRNWVTDPNVGIERRLADLEKGQANLAAAVQAVLQQVKPATHGTRDIAE